MKNVPRPTRKEVQDAIAKKAERIRAQANAKAKAAGHAGALEANWFECAACEAGLNATLAGLIAAAIAGFPEDTGAIAAIAAACGLSEATVTSILAAGGLAGVESVISSLCQAMGACS